MYPEIITNEEVTELPLGAFEGEIVVVDTPETMQLAYEHLVCEKWIGYDTETRPSFKKGHTNNVSLLQLSGSQKSFLFRLHKVTLSNEMLNLLESPQVLKIGAAIRDDIKSMRKLSEFTPGGFVDLQSKVGDFGIKELSVRKIAAIVLHIRISKAQRLSNWEAQQLTHSQQLYAATDAWVCREIYLKLSNKR